MADTKVTIDVDLNTSPAAQGLRDLQRQYNAFSSSLNRNNAAQATAARQYSDQLLRLVNSSQMFTAETVRMQTAAGRLDKTLAKGQVTMGQFFSARFLRDSNAAAQVLSLANARAAALQTQFFATSAAANGMRDAIAVRPYEAFNSALAVSAQKLAIHRAMLMQATTHMINFGKNTQWAGRQLMVGFTVPLTIFGGVAGKVFRELEEEVINFKKVYGDIFTTEEETGKALAAVQELSKEFTKYGIAVKDTMALANVAAQSGLRNAELMAATTQATRLATLGQMEQAEAMKTIISLQTAFKSSNEDLAESVDFLNIIENQTVLALQDVASAIPRVAPVIQGLGGDVKDLAVLLVAMKEGGVTAGEGANALKSSLGRLIVPTKAAKEMAAEFGISLEQIVENNRGQLLPMIMELGQALEGVDSLGRQQLLSTIFGKFQYARIGALFDNITRDSSQAARAMELMNLSAAELGQIAEKELATVEQSVGARFTAAMEKAKLAIAPLGEAFLNLSIPLINMFTKIIEKFNELPDFAKKFAVFGSVIVGVVIPVGTMFLGLLMNLVGTLIKFGAIIGIAFKGFTSGGIKGAIQAVSQALNYMSLEEIDAANAAQQLGSSTQIVNEALRTQVGRTAEAATGINQLGAAYASLILRMREAAALSATQGGAFVVPGAAADLARKGPRPRGYNKGGKILKFNDGNTVPGVGNTDTVPAMLTPGEFVVNKQATQDNLGLLQAINDGNVQYRNKGGGIATPGRMFYGRIPSAEDFVAMAAKGINPLDDLARAQRREAGIGQSSVSLPITAPVRHLPARMMWQEKSINQTLGKLKQGGAGSRITPPTGSQIADDLNSAINSGVHPMGIMYDIATQLNYNKEQTIKMFQNLSGRLINEFGSYKNMPISNELYEAIVARYQKEFMSKLTRTTLVNGKETTLNLFDELGRLGMARGQGGRRAGNVVSTSEDGIQIKGQHLIGQAGGYSKFSKKHFELTSDLYGGNPPTTFENYRKLIEQYQKGHNEGGIIEGFDGRQTQKLALGGQVLSRAAQLRRIKDANVGTMIGLQDNALSKVLKLRFNDVKGAQGPADFVKGMFSRWETTPTRISPKENTTMLLKGKKPKYAPIKQEDYLTDMIVSLDKFADTADAFKPIKIGTGFDGAFRVFDGHTRLHAQTVKALIKRLTGRDTSTMSRDEILEGVRLVQQKSLAGELRDADILRSVAGQRVLSTRAGKREVEVLNERPGRAAPMGSMLNRDPRVLLPEIHGKEIDAIVEAARKANFYGVKKDPDSLMQAMGFISLGGGAKYRYEPTRKIFGQPERRSFVRNMSRKIIDDLIDSGEILPLRRNKGGIIPGIQYRNDGGEIFESGGRTIVPGVGNTDTVPAMLTPGEFVVNKQATQENKSLLQAINSGVPLNMGGRVPGVQFLAEGDSVRAAKLPPGQSPTKIISGQWSDVEPGKVLGLDKNGKPITNPATADGLLKQGKLFGWDGKPITQVLKPNPEAVKALTDLLDDEKQVKKFTMTRAQKIWAVISALTMGATVAGMSLYERNKRDTDPLAGYNKGGRVPAMLTPGEFIVDRDKAQQNLGLLHAINNGEKLPGYAIGGLVAGAAQFALPMGLSLAATPLGAKAGESMGGDTGAMIGAMAAGMAPFLLPWGKILGGMRGGAAAAGSSDIKKTTTIAGTSQGAASASSFASNFAKVSAHLGKFARVIPLVFNPWTALAAAVIGTTYALNRMGKSNMEEFKRGQAYADALTTSAEDIKAIGSTARQRAENMDQWLDQSEAQFIQEEYAAKIAQAKTKAEKKLLETERDRAMQERGTMTRRESYEKFYDQEIKKAVEAGATQDNLRRLYEQRNRTLGVSKGQKLDFGFDKTFGAEFIKGAGQKDFRQFQMTRDLANQAKLGNVSQAELQTITRLATAAYGATSSLQSVAELDMASKLAQYVLSGAMTEDQASSVAAAIGMELGNLKIGDSIRNELSGLVGAEGQFAKFAPGSVATELMERNMRRTEEIEKITRQNLSYLLAQRREDQIPANTRSGLGLNLGGPAGFNLFTQFFSGMADEARRNVGSLIEIQTSEYQMLQENIDAVGLAYNDLIAKAKTLQEAEAYRYERARAIEKLQLRRDELQEQRQQMLFGNEQNRQRLLEIGQARQQAVFQAQLRNARARDYTDSLPGPKFPNIFSNQNLGNVSDQLFGALRRIGGTVGEAVSTTTAEAAANLEETFASSFAQIMTTQLRDAALKKYEGTSIGVTLQELAGSEFMPISSDPIYAQFWQSVLDEENFRNVVPAFVLALDTRLADEVAAGKIGHEAGMRVAQNIVAMASSFELPADVITQLMVNFSALDLKQIQSITQAFSSLGDQELTDAAYERFAPLLTALGELAAIKLPNFGNKTLIESIMGDPEVFNKLGQNDDAMEKLIEFFQTLEGLDPELQLDFLEQFKSIPQILVAMEAIQNTKLPRIISGLESAREKIKGLSEQDMPTQKIEEFSNYLTNFIDKINNIEDPEVKAKVTAEIAPEFYTAMNALRMFNLEQDPGKRQQYLDIFEDNVVAMAEQERAITEAGGDKKKKETTGSGGTKEDPLGDLMRQLRDTADLLSDVGTELLSVNRQARSIFGKLREEGVNEVVIDYLMSMGPEQALKVGEEVLRDSKKLNTLMQQAGEVELARQQNATQVAQSRAKFMKEMIRSGPGRAGVKALSGAPMLDLEAALMDEEFIKSMEAARGTAQPNKMMRAVQESYFARLNAERQAMSSMAPAIVASQAQQNISQTYAANQLRMRGLSEEEVQTALQSETIMNRVRQRLSESKSIGPVIVKMAKDLYASTQTMMTILDQGISKVEGVFDFLSESLNNATQQIDKFTIKPLQDDLEDIQESNASMAETQRRLSRSLTLLQETESDTRERQKQDEDKINESYDLRIEALEKVDKINKDIEDRQKGQISVADALSRGDIGAAARAAQEMQAKAAQARREEAIQAMRDQKEEDMDNLKKAHEEELKNLTISVNGELLTREQIQERIDDLETKIYDNSLKEYDIQQKINKALEERRKIEDQIERVGIARQALTQLRTINQATDEGTRRQTIASTQQTLQLLGGPESEKLIQAINQNFEGLLSTDETVFGVAMQQIMGEFGPLMGTIGSDIGKLDIQIPNIQAALDSAVATANTELPNIFTGIATQISNLNDSIDTDPESEDNPFAKVYKALKKVAAKIEKEFAKIPDKIGGGGGGKGPDEPKVTTTEDDGSIQLGPKVEQQREGTYTRYEIVEKEGVTYKVTKFYDKKTGLEIPHLIKYDVVQKKQIARGDFIYETVREDVQQGLSPDVAELRLPTNQLPSGYRPRAPYTLDQRIPGAGSPGETPPNLTAMGFGAVGSASSDLFGGIMDTLFGWVPWNKKKAKEAGQEGAEGYQEGYNDHFQKPKTDTEMGDQAIESVERGQESQSPAERFKPVGKYGAQGYVEGFKEYFEDSTDTILGAKIIGWFRRSMGSEGGDSPAVSGIGRNISGSIAIQISKAFTELTTTSLPINVAAWLRRSLGIEGINISSQIKLVGESIAIGIKKGMEEWFGKLNVDIREPLKTWLNNAFGTVGGEPSTQSKPIGGLIASGIKEGMKNWFDTGKSSGNDLWNNAFNPWLKEAFGINEKEGQAASTKTKEIGEKLTAGIAKGMETVPDLGEVANNIYLATGTSLGMSVNSKTGSVSPGAQGSKFYELGVSILDTVIKGINDQNVNSRLDAAINSRTPKEIPPKDRYFGGVIRRAFGGMISYKGSREPAPGMMMGGKVKKYAIGGFVPGRGMTDKVPALLTPGEFVVRKSVAQQMMPALKDMNSQVFPGMGVPQQRSLAVSSPQFDTMKKMSVDQVRFGVPQNISSFTYPTTNMNVTQSNTETSPTNYNVGPSNVQYNYNLNITARTNASPDEIANTVMYKIKRFDDRRIKGTEIG